jgi:hypothetical protein
VTFEEFAKAKRRALLRFSTWFDAATALPR